MTAAYVSQRASSSKALTTSSQPFAPIRTTGASAQTWTRPADWITMPSLTSGVDKKIYIIAAVFNNNGNLFALKFTGTGTGVSIDWGDGQGVLTYNYTAGTVTASYGIDWANISSGTLSSRGYRQALVTITLQAGSTLTGFNCDVVNTTYSSAGNALLPVNTWLDMSICVSDITTLQIGSSSALAYTSMLERINLVQTGALITGNSLFRNCGALQNLPVGPNFSASASDASSMFQDCWALEQVPDISMPNATGGINMFANCYSLIDPGPLSAFGTSYASTQDFGQMYQNCYSLVSVPAFPYNGAKSQSYSSTFQNCYSLKNVPPINIGAVSSLLNAMFSNCYNLRTVQLIGVPAGAVNGSSMFSTCYRLVNVTMGYIPFNNAASMFNGCYSIETLPDFDFSSTTTNATSVFQNCFNLRKVGTVKLGAGTSGIGSMFSGCANLTSFGGFIGATSGVTNPSSLFSGCSSIESIPDMSFGAVTTFASMFTNCYKLRTAPNVSMILLSNSLLSALGMFSNCYSLVTVPSYSNWNWGTTAPTAASMFSGCSSLQVGPTSIGSNSSRIQTYASMFSACYSLREAAAMDITSATTLTSMFQNCYSLQVAPTLTNTTAVTAAINMFSGCRSLTEIPAYNFNGISSAANIATYVANCPTLSRVQVSNTRFTISYASCRLAAAQLNEIYTNLPTISAQTITVTANFGVSGDNPAIATAKGWTVTGS